MLGMKKWLRENRFVTDSLLMMICITIVNVGNYLYNLILGRWLGPAAFSDLSLIITLMLLVTFITVTFQLTTAKFVAEQRSAAGVASIRTDLSRAAWWLGMGVALIFLVGASASQTFFQTASALPFVILGIGLPIYFVQGVERGVLQGQTDFWALSLSYLAEMGVRLGVGLGLVWLGWGVNGAVWGVSCSFVAAWAVSLWYLRHNAGQKSESLSAEQREALILFAWPVIITNIGQILINNSDLLLVKRFFGAEEAGWYAAVALVGRIVFFATWSVTTTVFPQVAQRQARGEATEPLLWRSLGIVATLSIILVGICFFFPQQLITLLFGREYLAISHLLWLYALATAFYASANVFVTYALALHRTKPVYLAMVAGVTQVIVLWRWHHSLYQIVLIQVFLMVTLSLTLVILWLVERFADRGQQPRSEQSFGRIEKISSF